MTLLLTLADALAPLATVVHAADPTPEPEDVRAGWTALFVFLGLIGAVALLMWSFTRQLRRTRRSADRGVFAPSERVRRGFPQQGAPPPPADREPPHAG